MMEEKLLVCQLHDLGRSKCQPTVVGISEHCSDRGDGFQFKDQASLPDIARVQDMVDPGQQIGNFRVEKIVCVRNDADVHIREGRGRFLVLLTPNTSKITSSESLQY